MPNAANLARAAGLAGREPTTGESAPDGLPSPVAPTAAPTAARAVEGGLSSAGVRLDGGVD